MQSKDRDMRIEASNIAYYSSLKKMKKSLMKLFDKLVKLRNKIAKKLGFDNFVELGYIRMLRTDYNADMVLILESKYYNI